MMNEFGEQALTQTGSGVRTDPKDGVTRRFESDPVWRHPGGLTSVTVHIDPADPRQRHVAA